MSGHRGRPNVTTAELEQFTLATGVAIADELIKHEAREVARGVDVTASKMGSYTMGSHMARALVKVWGKDSRTHEYRVPTTWWDHWKHDMTHKHPRVWVFLSLVMSEPEYTHHLVNFRALWPYNGVAWSEHLGKMTVAVIEKEEEGGAASPW